MFPDADGRAKTRFKAETISLYCEEISLYNFSRIIPSSCGAGCLLLTDIQLLSQGPEAAGCRAVVMGRLEQ
jgi:hypothetical protein